ncbi:MAG: hypothetical protein ABIC91_08265 [Nanoarchaeota archaeon]|nr:hypothetical protein [Nanoarchaeota archaeon]MBU1031079.1 hypothetical protein [Nanoarchaeota archaeon]MBU1850502.1 hypothetical protein [Nanoarchaeota archaeon]
MIKKNANVKLFVEPKIQKIIYNHNKLEDKKKIEELIISINRIIKYVNLPETYDLLSDAINSLEIKKNHLKQEYFQKPGFRLLQMGIPYSINSGVVTVLKTITKAFQKNFARA